MINQLETRREAFRQEIRRKANKNTLTLKREALIHSWEELKEPTSEDIPSLIDRINQTPEGSHTRLLLLNNLVYQLGQEDLEGIKEQQMREILIRSAAIFLSSFKGKSVEGSEQGLLGLYNLMVDLDKFNLRTSKLELIDSLIEAVREQKSTREFTKREFENIQFLYSHFLQCNGEALQQSQVREILWTLSEDVHDQRLIKEILSALEQFLRDPNRLDCFRPQLQEFISWVHKVLFHDNQCEISLLGFRVLNILLSSHCSEIHHETLQDMLLSLTKYMKSASEAVQTSLLMTLTTALKHSPEQAPPLLAHFTQQLLTHLQFSPCKVKQWVLILYKTILSEDPTDFSSSLTKSSFFSLVISLLEFRNEDIVLECLQILQICVSLREKRVQQEVSSYLISRGLEQALEKVMSHQDKMVSELAVGILSKLGLRKREVVEGVGGKM